MERIEFDSKTGPNNNRKNGLTRHGAIDFIPWLEREEGTATLEIHGPQGANRGGAVIDKATARKLGAALLKWAGFNLDVPLLVSQIEFLADIDLEFCDEQKGLLNLLGALRDLFEPA